MRNIETIVFDLGGVLIDWNPVYLYSKIFDDPQKVDYFLTHVCNNEWNAEQDRGRTFAEAIKLKQTEFPEYSEAIAAYFDRWPEMISGAIKETEIILNRLYDSGNYRLYALTNWSSETFPYAWANFELLRKFEGILVSGKEDLIKPDPEIYKRLNSRFDINPEATVFIDDSLKNNRMDL